MPGEEGDAWLAMICTDEGLPPGIFKVCGNTRIQGYCLVHVILTRVCYVSAYAKSLDMHAASTALHRGDPLQASI